MINRYIELNELFFEGLGIWVGDGSKSKGLYFGNTSKDLLLHFLKFSEEVLGFSRKNFKAVIIVPNFEKDEEKIKRKWSKILKIPTENFRKVTKKRKGKGILRKEYVQLYFDSEVLLKLMKSFYLNIRKLLSLDKRFVIGFLRGIFSTEGSVIIKPETGTLFNISISSKDIKLIKLLKELLERVDVQAGKYIYSYGMKFPIYGKRNFEKLERYEIFKLNSEKNRKFAKGFSNFRRNVEKGEEVKKKILEKLLFKPMTYDELSKDLGKGRSTIQSHYIPKLIEEELVKYLGKRGKKLLFGITEKGKEFLLNLD